MSKTLSFLHQVSFATLWKNQLFVHVCVYFWMFFPVSLICLFLFKPIHTLDYFGHILSLEISSFVLHFQSCFESSGFCCVPCPPPHMDFRITCQFQPKEWLGFWLWVTFNLYINLGKTDILAILRLLTYGWIHLYWIKELLKFSFRIKNFQNSR